MAPRRDGGADRRQTILALASGRRRGEILDLLVQRRRDAGAVARLMRKLLKKRGFAPALLVTDKLRSYGLDCDCPFAMSRVCAKNNRAENSHLPVRRRERKMRLAIVVGGFRGWRGALEAKTQSRREIGRQGAQRIEEHSYPLAKRRVRQPRNGIR
jgi:hypothetical protein